MMRFYGVSDADCMQMPFLRLLILYQQIPVLEAEEELRLLAVQYSADPKRRAADLQRLIGGQGHTSAGEAATTNAIGRLPGITYEAAPGSIRAEHERQRAAAARIEAEWRAAQSRGASRDLPGQLQRETPE